MPFHPIYLVVILVVVLIIFGPGRLPELGGAVGKAMREFRKATTELTNEVTAAVQTPPAAPAAPAPPAPSAATPEGAPAKGPESSSSFPS